MCSSLIHSYRYVRSYFNTKVVVYLIHGNRWLLIYIVCTCHFFLLLIMYYWWWQMHYNCTHEFCIVFPMYRWWKRKYVYCMYDELYHILMYWKWWHIFNYCMYVYSPLNYSFTGDVGKSIDIIYMHFFYCIRVYRWQRHIYTRSMYEPITMDLFLY